MVTQRREFLIGTAAALTGAPLLAAPRASATERPRAQRDEPAGGEQVAMLLYPECTALDFVGPQYAFGCLDRAEVHHVAATMDPVRTDTGLSLLPTMTLDECPRDVDVLFVPGGTTGTLAAMRDERVIRFIADRGARAKWVTSVCTGSLLLGAAGLLRGYQATSHWMAHHLLPDVGAIPVDSRVVVDRNRVTGAGVSAGIDLGLTLVALLRDQHYAESVQLMAEYAPQPPFNAGSPKTAPPDVTASIRSMAEDFVAGVSSTLAAMR